MRRESTCACRRARIPNLAASSRWPSMHSAGCAVCWPAFREPCSTRRRARVNGRSGKSSLTCSRSSNATPCRRVTRSTGRTRTRCGFPTIGCRPRRRRPSRARSVWSSLDSPRRGPRRNACWATWRRRRRRAAFVGTSLSEERDEYLANSWIVGVDGGTPRRFTAGPRRDIEPRWSRDGTRLAFLSERAPKDKLQLYVMPADGGEPTKLTALENGVGSIAWSPEGSRLAFVSAVGGQREPDSEEEKRKSRPARVITAVKYRFNGEGFVYDRRPHVFMVSTDGSAPVQLTDGDFIDADPTWSPDGDSIVFASARHAERDDAAASDLSRVPAKGGTPQRLTATTGPIMLPAFSPDGRSIAYL